LTSREAAGGIPPPCGYGDRITRVARGSSARGKERESGARRTPLRRTYPPWIVNRISAGTPDGTNDWFEPERTYLAARLAATMEPVGSVVYPSVSVYVPVP